MVHIGTDRDAFQLGNSLNHVLVSMSGDTGMIIMDPLLELGEGLLLSFLGGLSHDVVNALISLGGVPALSPGAAAGGLHVSGHGAHHGGGGGVVVAEQIPILAGTQEGAVLGALNVLEFTVDVDLLQQVLDHLGVGGVSGDVSEDQREAVVLIVAELIHQGATLFDTELPLARVHVAGVGLTEDTVDADASLGVNGKHNGDNFVAVQGVVDGLTDFNLLFGILSVKETGAVIAVEAHKPGGEAGVVMDGEVGVILELDSDSGGGADEGVHLAGLQGGGAGVGISVDYKNDVLGGVVVDAAIVVVIAGHGPLLAQGGLSLVDPIGAGEDILTVGGAKLLNGLLAQDEEAVIPGREVKDSRGQVESELVVTVDVDALYVVGDIRGAGDSSGYAAGTVSLDEIIGKLDVGSLQVGIILALVMEHHIVTDGNLPGLAVAVHVDGFLGDDGLNSVGLKVIAEEGLHGHTAEVGGLSIGGAVVAGDLTLASNGDLDCVLILHSLVRFGETGRGRLVGAGIAGLAGLAALASAAGDEREAHDQRKDER